MLGWVSGPTEAFWLSAQVARPASPRMAPSPAAFTPLPREIGRRESEPREPGLRPPELDPRPLESLRGSGPQSSSAPLRQEQQLQHRAQKERLPLRDRLSGSGSGEGVVGGCQGFPPQRPTSERGPSIMSAWKRQGGSGQSPSPVSFTQDTQPAQPETCYSERCSDSSQ